MSQSIDHEAAPLANPDDEASEKPQPGLTRITDALERILRSPEFHASPRQRRLLAYIVDETLAGRGGRLKAYTVATAVLGRGDRFDPQADPVVRIEVSKLRHWLDHYYLTEGRQELLRITIPKGTYVPVFEDLRAAADIGTEPATPPVQRRARRSAILGYAAAALTLLAIAGLAVHRWDASDDLGGPTIAVEAFTSQDGDPQIGAFVAGLSLAIVSDLTHFRTLQVFASDSKTTGTERIPIAYRLDGSVEKLTGGILITAQLWDESIRTVIYKKTFAVASDRIASARLDVARAIAEGLGDPFGQLFIVERAHTAAKKRPRDGIRHCILGFYEYAETDDVEQHRRSRDCHEAAVRETPTYAQAWINLSLLYIDEHRFGYNPLGSDRPPALDRARDAALRALAIDPTDARAHLALALTQWFNHAIVPALAEADRALEMNPNDPMVLAEVGLRRFLVGDWDSGAALVRQALTNGSGRPLKYHYVLAMQAYMRGNYALALDEAVQGGSSRLPVADILLPAIYGKLGRTADARVAWDALSVRYPSFVVDPRTEMLNRNFAPVLIDALLRGFDEANLLSD